MEAGEINASLTKYVCNGNGSNSSTVPSQGVRIGFDTTTTWTCPTGVTQITVELWGGAGGGAGILILGDNYASDFYEGGSGGAGGYIRQTLSVIPGNNYSIVIGLGGEAGTGNSNIDPNIIVCSGNGFPGSASSFNNSIFAFAGTGGIAPCGKGGCLNCRYITSPANNGNSGQVTNYPIQYSTRSYLPSYYLNQRPIISSQGGRGGYGNQYIGINNAQVGENGFCVISY